MYFVALFGDFLWAVWLGFVSLFTGGTPGGV